MSNTSQPEQMKKGKRGSRLFGCVVAGGILFPIAVAVIAFGGIVYTSRLDSRIAELEQRIRDKGQPVTLEELAATYPVVPYEENAALVYLEAIARVEEIDPGFDRCSDLTWRVREVESKEHLPQDLRKGIGQLTAELERVFELFDVASNMPNARFEIDFSQAIQQSPTHLEPLRNCAWLEFLRARLAAESGDPERALQCQRNILRMAESMRMEPLLMPQLVRTSIYNVAVEALAYHLERAPLPEPTMQELGALYEHAEDPVAMIRAFIGERCASVNYVDALFSGKSESKTSTMDKLNEQISRKGRWLSRPFYSAANQVRLLEGFQPLVDLSEASWPEQVACWSGYEPPRMYIPLPTNFAPGMVPAQYHSIPAFARGTAFLRMARSALALECYRAENGHLPATLAALVPEYLSAIPEDPFDGQPLRYTPLETGYRLHSVAQDLIDDGGIPAEKDQTGTLNGDWVFEVRR